METVANIKNYKRAFKCGKCPGRNDEQGCPMWWEFVQGDANGNERMVKQCGYTAMPQFLVATIAASNRPAAEIGSMKNAMLKQIGVIGGMLEKQQKGLLENDKTETQD